MKSDNGKTKEQLISELAEMRQRVAELESPKAEKKHTEESLRESEENYRDIMELAPDGIVTVDIKGVVTSCNIAFSRLMGFSKEEIVGKHFSKLPTANAKDIPQYFKIFASLLKGKESKPMELAWKHKDGTQRLCEFQGSLMKRDNKIVGLQAIARDITERRRVWEALRESEEKFSRAFHSNPHPMSIVTLEEGRYLDVNDSYVQTFGFSREELLGRTTVEMGILKNDRTRRKILQSLKERQAIKNLELELYTRSGRKVDGLLSGDKTEIGGQTCLLSVLTDITERKQAEEKRTQLIQELQETLKEVRTLSGLLPICAWCKKLRDDEGYWKSVEQYIGERTKAEFTHGMCPECYDKFQVKEDSKESSNTKVS